MPHFTKQIQTPCQNKLPIFWRGVWGERIAFPLGKSLYFGKIGYFHAYHLFWKYVASWERKLLASPPACPRPSASVREGFTGFTLSMVAGEHRPALAPECKATPPPSGSLVKLYPVRPTKVHTSLCTHFALSSLPVIYTAAVTLPSEDTRSNQTD